MKFCPKCGARRLTDMPFCGSCGIDFRVIAADRPRRTRAAALVAFTITAVVVAVAGIAACGSGAATAQPPAGATAAAATPQVAAGSVAPVTTTVRATPEDAVRQYLEGVAATDVHKLMDACAIDEVAEHFSFTAQAERLNAIVPGMLLPSDYPFYVEMNKYGQADRIFGQVRGLEYSILSGRSTDQTITPVSNDVAVQYVKDVDPSRLAGMKVVDVKFPIAKFATDSKTLANFAAMAKVYGADELTERLALVQVNGNYYAVGFQLVRYGQDWKVLSQVSNLAGMPSSGAAQPTTPGDFAASTAG